MGYYFFHQRQLELCIEQLTPPPLTPGGKIWLTHTEESSSVSGLWADLRRCHLVVALVLASIKLDHSPTILAHWFPTNKNLLWGREHSSRLSSPPPGSGPPIGRGNSPQCTILLLVAGHTPFSRVNMRLRQYKEISSRNFRGFEAFK